MQNVTTLKTSKIEILSLHVNQTSSVLGSAYYSTIGLLWDIAKLRPAYFNMVAASNNKTASNAK